VTDELSPEQEADVRRLLAQARHDEPVPDDVAARLDDVLAGLVADEGVDDLEVFESDSGSSPGPVTDLAAARHRRRKAGRLLLAAAAVVVAGVAVGQNLDGVQGGDADSADAGGDAPAAADPRDSNERAPTEATDGAAGGTSSEPEPSTADASALLDQLQAPVTLTSRDFAADVARELARTPGLRLELSTQNLNGVTAYASANSDFVCAAGAYGEGVTLPAYYDAEEAVLVLRRPRSNVQRVDLLTCGTAVELNSVELPAP
jgi:hypothetical protein